MAAKVSMTERQKLRDLILDVFLLDETEFSFELLREQVETWDSLGVVSLAIGIEDVFGYHCTPEEAVGLEGVADIIALLREKGIDLDA